MNALYHFLTSEWYFSVPMVLMSIIAIMLICWRLLLNFRAAGLPMNVVLPEVQQKWETEGVEATLELVQNKNLGLIPNKLFASAIENYRQGTAAMRKGMAHSVELEILPDLNFLLSTMLAIAKIATMVGLLGTVISMINTFSAIGEATKAGGGAAGVAGSAGAIGLALFATALGLMTAIPLVFAHVMFKAWIGNFEVRMKSASLKLLAILQNSKPGTAAKPAVMGGS